jgi:hypothetical protein
MVEQPQELLKETLLASRASEQRQVLVYQRLQILTLLREKRGLPAAVTKGPLV